MQQVICVRAHGSFKPGDTSEVPDGAAVSDLYWQLAAALGLKVPPKPPVTPAAPAAETPKAGA